MRRSHRQGQREGKAGSRIGPGSDLHKLYADRSAGAAPRTLAQQNQQKQGLALLTPLSQLDPKVVKLSAVSEKPKEAQMIELTEQQAQALQNPASTPPRLVDPRTKETFVLLHEYERLKEEPSPHA